MKENIKKQMRLQVIVAMAVIAMVIMTGEAAEVRGWWLKGAAVVIAGMAYVLFRKWQKSGKLPEVEDV